MSATCALYAFAPRVLYQWGSLPRPGANHQEISFGNPRCGYLTYDMHGQAQVHQAYGNPRICRPERPMPTI